MNSRLAILYFKDTGLAAYLTRWMTAEQATAFMVLDSIEGKKRGPGAIICNCPTVGALRDNLFIVPVHYI